MEIGVYGRVLPWPIAVYFVLYIHAVISIYLDRDATMLSPKILTGYFLTLQPDSGGLPFICARSGRPVGR